MDGDLGCGQYYSKYIIIGNSPDDETHQEDGGSNTASCSIISVPSFTGFPSSVCDMFAKVSIPILQE